MGSPLRRPALEDLALSRSTHDRDDAGRALGIEHHLADPAARAIVLHRGRSLLRDGRLARLPATSVPAELALYLGRDEDGPLLALVLGEDAASALEGTWANLRDAGTRLDDADAGLFTQALALANWHASHGFSPRSGAPTIVEHSGWVRRDPATRAEVFPRTDPAVIVAVVDEADRILLGSNALWEPNQFSLLAGFVEPGESLEAAVIREVFEETGVRVADPEYLGSQPWPFPASLMLAFRARVAEHASTRPRPDGVEIVELRWFSREELAASVGEVLLPGRSSIARAVIEHWYGGRIEDSR